MSVLLEKLIFDKIFNYLHEFQFEVLILMLYNNGVKLGSKNIHKLVILAKGFLLVCTSSSPGTLLILITLKSWVYADEIDNAVKELVEDE